MKQIIFLFTFVFILFSCTNPKMLLKTAIKDEKKQKYDSAEQKYLTIIIKYSDSECVPEAKYRLGVIYKDIKKDYLQAQMWFSDIINRHKDSEFYKFACVGLLESPDYVGAIDGNKVVLGDVESDGRNMKIISEYKKIDYDLYQVTTKIYAGNNLVKQEQRFYYKVDTEIREYLIDPKKNLSTTYTTILKLPIKIGTKWETQKEKKLVECSIVEDSISLKFKDKEFGKCIKIMEQPKGEKGVRFLYYAPNKGCVKITTATIDNLKKEYPVVELVE